MTCWDLLADFTMQYPDTWPAFPPSTLSMLERNESKHLNSKDLQAERRNPIPSSLQSLFLCSLLFTCLLVELTTGIYFRAKNEPAIYAFKKTSTAWKNPVLRREWRSLNRTEKNDYIQSVKCLKTLPSRLQLNQTLYDDFSWIHNTSTSTRMTQLHSSSGIATLLISTNVR